jgi:hypothetical protein
MARKMAEGVYLCPQCETLKYAEDFYTDGNDVASRCKPCSRAYAAARRRLLPAKPKPVKLRLRLRLRAKGDPWIDRTLRFVDNKEEAY